MQLKDKPKCAVLLAVYNGINYLQEQITSILAQDNVDVTIFVSVDCSSDGSENWVTQFSTHNKCIVVLPHGYKFGNAAKNFFRLIKEVNFQDFTYIAFADQDDYWYSNKLSRAINVLSDSVYDAYSSNVLAFWPNGNELLINKAQPQKKWDFIFEAAGPGCTYVMTNKLVIDIKQNLLKDWSRAQQVQLHDWYCYAFARANNYRWYIDPEPTMLYRQHTNNVIGVNSGLKAYINRIYKIKSGWWLNQARLITELIGISDTKFVRNWSKLGRKELLVLSFNAFECRRRFLEKIYFFVICFSLAILGHQKE